MGGQFLMSEVPLLCMEGPRGLCLIRSELGQVVSNSRLLQGYLAHKKPPPLRTLPLAYA